MANEVNAGEEIRSLLGMPPASRQQQLKFHNKFNNQNNSFITASSSAIDMEEKSLLNDLAALAEDEWALL
jgi:hypothetical protein